MTRLWIRNLTSRNDSRTGAWVISRGAAGVGVPPPEGGVEAGPVGAGRLDGPAAGRALSIRFSRDIASPLQAPRGIAPDAPS